MCLGELGEVVGVQTPAEAEVHVGTRTMTVSLRTLPDPEAVAPGDWLIVHCGYALARITADEAADAERIREGST